ncbi:MAG: 50S ribosomal protein L9 [Proteobacteria bacterium]|nr:50S ribosomal protein L9 [Pseudomonadota bacterium]
MPLPSMPATAGALKKWGARRDELEKERQEKLTALREVAEQIKAVTCNLHLRAGKDGKLFGSVSTLDIAEAMQAAGYDLQKSEIHLGAGPLKDVGDHEIAVTLHPEIDIKITVSIVGED